MVERVGLDWIVLEVDQEDDRRLRSEGVRQGGGQGLDAGGTGTRVERQHLPDAHALDTDVGPRPKRRRVGREVERKALCIGLEEVEITAARRVVLVQDLEHPVDVDLLLHAGANRRRQARAVRGGYGYPQHLAGVVFHE